jgi:hypothetical protein
MAYPQILNNLSTTGEKLFDNGQIGVILAKIIKGKEPSKDIIDILPSGYNITPPSKGKNLFSILLNFKYTKGIHVIGIGGDDRDRSVLIDTDKNRYFVHYWAAVGFQVNDPHDVTKTEFGQGTKAVFIFEIPDRAKPEVLQFIYHFKIKWKDTGSVGQLLIEMPK